MRIDRFRLPVAGCGVALMLVLGACDGDDADPGAIPSAGEPAVDEPEPAQDTDAGQADAPADPAEAIATATLPIDWIDGGQLDLAVTGIEVAGELLRVAVAFTASVPPEVEDVAIGAVLEGNESAPGAAVRPELVDPVNLKAYEVVTGGTSNGDTVRLTDGAPRTLVFYYAAPRDELDTFDIHWSSKVPPLVDVPFTP